MFRRRPPGRAGFVGLLIAGVLAITAPSPAMACSCPSITPQDLIRRTPLILSGRVLDLEVSRPGDRSLQLTAVTVEITDAWKGEAPGRVIIRNHTDTSACGWPLPSPGNAFTVLVRPRGDGDPGVFSTDYCTMSSYLEQRPAVDGMLRRFRAERERLNTVIAAAPGSPTPRLKRAELFEEWDVPAALHDYAELSAAYPLQPRTHTGLGRALLAARRFEEARTALLRARELAPSDPEATRLLTQANLHLGDVRAVDGVRDLRGLTIAALDLSGHALPRRDFSDAWITTLRLSGADLRGARFRRGRFYQGSMAGADLRGADFEDLIEGRLDLSGARLDGARLAGANLSASDLRRASLRGVVGPGAILRGVATAGADFRGASLPGADFRHGRLMDTDFADARLTGANFEESNLAGADLSRADLRGAELATARYDERTRLPRGLDPEALYMVLIGGELDRRLNRR